MMSNEESIAPQPARTSTQEPVPPTDAEIALWDNIVARNAARRTFDDNQKQWACAWADYAVEQRRKRFGPR